MELISWKDRYSVQIDSIDKQHKKLVAIINSLHNAMMEKKTKDEMGKVLSELVNYTAEHFGFEEKLFDQHGYPGRINHKSAHKDFVAKVKDFQTDFENGKSTISMKLLSFLKDWLVKHIEGTDQEYSKFLVKKGVK
jgi:hemerythrin-like metal-binding protein